MSHCPISQRRKLRPPEDAPRPRRARGSQGSFPWRQGLRPWRGSKGSPEGDRGAGRGHQEAAVRQPWRQACGDRGRRQCKGPAQPLGSWERPGQWLLLSGCSYLQLESGTNLTYSRLSRSRAGQDPWLAPHCSLLVPRDGTERAERGSGPPSTPVPLAANIHSRVNPAHISTFRLVGSST